MKKILMVLMIIACQVSFSQTNKKPKAPPKKTVMAPPKIVRSLLEPPPVKQVNKIITIIKNTENPLAFKYEINKDTIILPKGEFSEIIQIDSYSEYLESIEVTQIFRTASDTMKFEFNDATKGERMLYSFYEDRKWGKGTVSKNVLTVVEKDTKSKVTFNVVLDKPKKKILYLENVATGRKYLPAEYQYPAPSIGF